MIETSFLIQIFSSKTWFSQTSGIQGFHLLDVRSFRDSTAKLSEPKKRSLHGGPNEDSPRPDPVLHRQQTRRCSKASSNRREAPVILQVHHIIITLSCLQHQVSGGSVDTGSLIVLVITLNLPSMNTAPLFTSGCSSSTVAVVVS